jgi:hypothetical protein
LHSEGVIEKIEGMGVVARENENNNSGLPNPSDNQHKMTENCITVLESMLGWRYLSRLAHFSNCKIYSKSANNSENKMGQLFATIMMSPIMNIGDSAFSNNEAGASRRCCVSTAFAIVRMYGHASRLVVRDRYHRAERQGR